MSDAVVVWLAEAPSEAGADAQAAARKALEAWARARDVVLSIPRVAETRALTVDLGTADRVEQELERARDAMAALDADAAERALARAEQDLYDHPELPEAAWLLAEVWRGWSSRWARLPPQDPDRAARAWERADGLDGGRAAGIGETKPATRLDAVAATLSVAPGVTAWVDGHAQPNGVVRRSPGKHQLVLTQDDLPIFAEWVTFSEGATMRIDVAATPACSAQDVARAKLDRDAVDASGIRCTSWVAVVAAAERGVVRVARCEQSRCGPLVEWRTSRSRWDFGRPIGERGGDHRGHWPAWATWTIVGASAAAAVGVLLVASGALTTSRTETRFVNGGVKVQGLGLTF